MERFKSGISQALSDIPKNKDEAMESKANFALELERFPFLAKLEEVTKRKREEIVGALLLVMFLVLLGGVFVKPVGIFMTRLFGFAYPCYKSFKAIESEGKDDDTQWLTYWMVFSVFALLEETALKLVEPIAPFFFVWKIIFLLWCYLPQTHGADFLYSEIVRPSMMKTSEALGDALGKRKEE